MMVLPTLNAERRRVSFRRKKAKLHIAMLGHKRIPSREGGIEIVVEELSTRMAALGHSITCFRSSR